MRRLLEEFKAIAIGKRKFLIGLVNRAVKPETKEKRILEVMEEVHQSRKIRERREARAKS